MGTYYTHVFLAHLKHQFPIRYRAIYPPSEISKTNDSALTHQLIALSILYIYLYLRAKTSSARHSAKASNRLRQTEAVSTPLSAFYLKFCRPYLSYNIFSRAVQSVHRSSLLWLWVFALNSTVSDLLRKTTNLGTRGSAGFCACFPRHVGTAVFAREIWLSNSPSFNGLFLQTRTRHCQCWQR